MLKILKHILLLVGTFLLPVTSLCAQHGDIENQIVEKVDITIEAQQPGKPILRSIQTRMKTREGELFSQATFDRDLKMLAGDYDRIEPLVESVDGKIYVTLVVWPNPVIRRICWEGNHQMKTSKLQKELGVSPRTVFDRDRFNRAFNKVKGYYVKNGHFETQLDYVLTRDPDTNEVDITITIEEGRAGKIRKIRFRHLTKCEQEDILAIMATKVCNPFLSWMTGDGIYNEEMVEHDNFIVLNYLQNRGYADAKVDLEVTECEGPKKAGIMLTFSATRGPCYCIGDITFEGNTLFSDEELSKCLRVCSGKAYSPERIQTTQRLLTCRYGRCGYIETVVNYEPKLREDGCIYDLKITIDEGEQFHVGLIKVLGNCSTQTRVILHETLLIPGEVFNLDKLQRTEERLVNIGYFKNVNVYAVKSDAVCLLPGNYRDVHIEVEEMNTGNLGAFLGFGTVENMFGGINLTEKNFNYKGLGCVFSEGMRALRGGGEYAHITLQLGAKSRSYVFSWTKPYFMDTPWSVGFDIDQTQKDYLAENYKLSGYGLTVHATYDCNAFTKVGTHYRIRYNDVHECHDHHDDHDHHDETPPPTERRHGPTVAQAAKNDGIISAIGVSWLYDSTNRPMQPSSGLKSRIEGEFAGLGGDYTFLSAGYQNCYYVDCGDGVLKFRGDLRFIQPLGDTDPTKVPLDERFFLGGDNEIRGYRSFRLGPKFHKINGKVNKEDPRGGISMQIFSVEYSKPLFSKCDLFLFVDAGSVSMEKWDVGDFYYSTGYGCRLYILGNGPPLTLGMGYPLNPKNSNDVKRFFITVGGKF